MSASSFFISLLSSLENWLAVLLREKRRKSRPIQLICNSGHQSFFLSLTFFTEFENCIHLFYQKRKPASHSQPPQQSLIISISKLKLKIPLPPLPLPPFLGKQSLGAHTLSACPFFFLPSLIFSIIFNTLNCVCEREREKVYDGRTSVFIFFLTSNLNAAQCCGCCC